MIICRGIKSGFGAGRGKDGIRFYSALLLGHVNVGISNSLFLVLVMADKDNNSLTENWIYTFLEGLTPSDFARILTRVPDAQSQISSAATHYEQVAALLRFVKSRNGMGIERFSKILESLFADSINLPLAETIEDIPPLSITSSSQDVVTGLSEERTTSETAQSDVDTLSIGGWKRQLYDGPVLSKSDLPSINVEIPKGARFTDVTYSPDANNILVTYREDYKGTFEKLSDLLRGKSLAFQNIHEYRIKDGTHLGNFGVFEKGVSAISLSPDGSQLGIIQYEGGCLIMDLRTRVTQNIDSGLGGREVRWTSDSSRCLFGSYNMVLLKPDGSIKRAQKLGTLYECLARNSWLGILRDAVVEIDRDLTGHLSEIFVLDSMRSGIDKALIAVSPSGKYIAIGQFSAPIPNKYGSMDCQQHISIYDSENWSRIGFRDTKRVSTISNELYWLSEESIGVMSLGGLDIYTVPELHLKHTIGVSSENKVLPSFKGRPAYLVSWGYYSSFSVTTLENV